ncbi:MAG TPA: GDP-L-fucose synthase [Bacteroidia bacterium]|nr:GDP-L-fucose synthase [Bacteroidia bacterium]
MFTKRVKIFVAGSKGMVGSAILRELQNKNYENILTVAKSEVNLTDQPAVNRFLQENKPEAVILAAAKVGGINANMKAPAQFLYENLMIQNNVIHSSYLAGVKKFVFPGSSCIYPRECPQPMKEEYLLTGKLEPTNEGYAIAKIAGIKMMEYYHRQYGFKSISLMPCNLYGPNDSFDLQHSHVLSALVKRFTDAADENKNEITLWGSGIAKREFMHVDDLARITVYMMEHHEDTNFINIGWGEDISIKELAEMIASKTNFKGKINWDTSKPDGMLRKCMDVSKMKALGIQPEITLEKGVEQMISIYKKIKSQPQTINP